MHKKIIISILYGALMVPLGLQAVDLEVFIMNGTTQKAGKVDRLIIADPMAGMMPLATKDNVSGTVFLKDIKPVRMIIVQGFVNGITYNQTINVPVTPPDTLKATLTVYDETEGTEGLQVEMPYYVIFAVGDTLEIQKRLAFKNETQPPRAMKRKDGLIRFYIPEKAELQYATIKYGTMPLKVAPKMFGGGQAGLDTPLRPGETQVDVGYFYPYTYPSTTIKEAFYFDVSHIHVFVSPINLKVSAPGLVREGEQADRNMAIYSLQHMAAGDTLVITLSGKSMSPNEAQAMATGGGGRIEVRDRISFNRTLLFTGGLTVLLVFVLIWVTFLNGEGISPRELEALRAEKQRLETELATLEQRGNLRPKHRRQLEQRIAKLEKTLQELNE